MILKVDVTADDLVLRITLLKDLKDRADNTFINYFKPVFTIP